jgi:transcription elongation factor GreA-like protein
MADFEKHIAFDVGNYVFHRTWNIGRIAAIRGDEIVKISPKTRTTR